MEEVAAHDNLAQAMKRVRKNRGSPGIDGMTVDELPGYLERNGRFLQEQLLAGNHQARPVRWVTIPKPDEGERELGIPTVMDRLVQQAILQVLGPRFDASFSRSRRCWPTCRSGELDQLLERAGTASCATLTTATYTCGPVALPNE